jgi:NADH dehydrogenase
MNSTNKGNPMSAMPADGGETPRPERKRVVIVGDGFAGIAAAHALQHADAEVVLIDRRNHHIFRPLLYQVATAVLSPAEIAAHDRRDGSLPT